MRLKTLAAIVSFVLLILNDGALGQQSGRSVDSSPEWNDNALMAVQKTAGNPTRSGDVKIEFYGHDAFKFTSPAGLTVLTDPGEMIQQVFTQSGSSASSPPSGLISFSRPTLTSTTMLWGARKA
jgi:hypothetical protein